MKKTATIIALLCTLVFLSLMACAPNRKAPEANNLRAKMMQPPEGKALVFFVRPTNYGGGQSMTISINNKPIGKLYGELFMYRVLEPGKYIFSSKAENTSELVLNLQPDKIYYVEQQIKMGLFSGRNNLVLLDAVEGKEKLMRSYLALPGLE